MVQALVCQILTRMEIESHFLMHLTYVDSIHFKMKLITIYNPGMVDLETWQKVLCTNVILTQEQLLAWEWGNPTLSSPQSLLNKLKSFENMGSRRDQVLWFSDQWHKNYHRKNINGTIVYDLAFVVTQDQMHELCGIASCVVP